MCDLKYLSLAGGSFTRLFSKLVRGHCENKHFCAFNLYIMYNSATRTGMGMTLPSQDQTIFYKNVKEKLES